MKQCYKCHKAEPAVTFGKDASRKDGLQPKCKACEKRYRDARKAQASQYGKSHYRKHKAAYLTRQAAYRKKNPVRLWAYHTLEKHRRQGYTIAIEVDELLRLATASANCRYCGCALKWGGGRYADNSPTLDRTNNGKRLTSATVQILCRRCNLTKQDRTHAQFVAYCATIASMFGVKEKH